MAIRRGTIYRIPRLVIASGLLVLTNDEWNEAPTEELSGALVFAEAGAGRTAIPGLAFHAGQLLRVPKGDLTDPLVELSPDELARVEDGVFEILGLDDLLSERPRAPVAQPGEIDYPRWSNIYRAGDRIGTPPERKRYLVVSHDRYNRALGGAICVRTTSSVRRGGPTIPTLGDGVTKAVCALPTFWSSHRVGIREARPVPAQLFMPDMRIVAAALLEALALPRPGSRRTL